MKHIVLSPVKRTETLQQDLPLLFLVFFLVLHYANPLRESFCILMGATWEKCWHEFWIWCHDCSDLHTRNSQQCSGQDTAADRLWCHLRWFVSVLVQACFPFTFRRSWFPAWTNPVCSSERCWKHSEVWCTQVLVNTKEAYSSKQKLIFLVYLVS